MKKFITQFIMILLMAISSTVVAEAQFVKIRPAGPVFRARPISPSPTHVWVGGNYVWRGGQYVYTNGYWAVPPGAGMHWVEGRWKHRRGGWVWVPGHWKRVR